MISARVSFVVAAMLSILLHAQPSAAAPSSRLVYSRGPGAETCPEESALREAIAARVGYDPFFPIADVTVVAKVRRDGSVLRANVELIDAHGLARGARELTGKANEDCAELISAMALAISIALDTIAVTAPIRPPPPAPAPPEPAVASEPRVPAVASDPAATAVVGAPIRIPPTPLVVDVGLSVAGAVGTAPSPSLGGEVFVRLRRASLSLAFEGHADLPASRLAFNGDTIGTELQTGSLVPCYRWRAVAACGVATVGVLYAIDSRDQSSAVDSAIYLAAGARLATELPLSQRFSLHYYGQSLANIVPATIQVRTVEVWRGPAISFSAGFGMIFHF